MRCERSLVFRYLGVKIHALHTHQLEIIIHQGSAQLVSRQLDTEEEGGSRLGLEHDLRSPTVERGKEGRERGKSAVKCMLDVRLRALVVDYRMNRECASRRKGGRSGMGFEQITTEFWSRSNRHHR